MSHPENDTNVTTPSENTADEPAVKDGTDPNDTVVSDDIDAEMLRDDAAER
ncbi:MAG: hypothetical protein ABI074_15240 [Nakamurella sp.]